MINQTKISGQRKKELEQPDPFLESLYNGLDTVKQYKKQIVFASGVIVSIICIVSVTMYMIRSSEIKASEMLAQALENYKALAPAEGYDAVKGDFDRLLDEYPNTSSGKIANVRFGEICYAAKKYDRAYTLYKAALNEYKRDAVMRDLLLISLGHTCQALQKKDEAEKYFSELIGDDTALMKAEGLFQLGMLAISGGDREKGLEMMQEVASLDGGSIYKTMADTILAQN